jgi:hypothetical protein
MALSERERAIRLRLRVDLEYYAARCLKIRTKSGKIEALIFNRMQRYLHQRIEEHATRNGGRVRVLILQGATARLQHLRFRPFLSSGDAPPHAHSVSVHFMHYNFVRIHQSLRVTPAMAAGVTTKLWSITDMVRIIEEREDLRSGALVVE